MNTRAFCDGARHTARSCRLLGSPSIRESRAADHSRERARRRGLLGERVSDHVGSLLDSEPRPKEIVGDLFAEDIDAKVVRLRRTSGMLQ